MNNTLPQTSSIPRPKIFIPDHLKPKALNQGIMPRSFKGENGIRVAAKSSFTPPSPNIITPEALEAGRGFFSLSNHSNFMKNSNFMKMIDIRT